MSDPSQLPVGEAVEAVEVVPPAHAALVGRFVSVEPLELARHADGLFAAGHGSPRVEKLWTYLPYGPFADPDAMRAWLDPLASSVDPLFFAVVSGDGEPLGMTSYLNIDTSMRRVEVGHIWYGPAAQRTEANTEACLLLLRAAFDGRYRRVEWKCDALNARSRAAALRLGFTFEGIFRNHMIVKGRNRDTAWYSVTDAEWPDRRTRLERWLASPPSDREPLTQA